jgi:alanine racemase
MHQYGWYSQYRERSQLATWLKVDSGMGRLGVQPEQARDILQSNNGITWRGMLTHFACADETDNPFTDQQIDIFQSVAFDSGMDLSLANSSAVLAWPRAQADWARPGIMLYGCNPLAVELPDGVELRPAMTVCAPLISMKMMRAGSGIGYAQTWKCPEDMPVGYVALGYRDGLPRVLNESATVNVNGTKCPIIGRVSMDSVAVDLRHCAAPEPGTSVEFWGSTTSIDDLARAADTINYELLTSIRGHRDYIV